MLILKKTGVTLIFTLLVLVAITFGIILYKYQTAPLIHTNKLVTIKILPGTGSASLVRHLKQNGIIKTPWLWKYFVAVTTFGHELKAGEYEIKPGMSFNQLVENITNGQVYLRQITLVEGWRYRNFKNILEKNVDLKHVISHLTQSEVITILGSHHVSLEGLLFPDTYFYTWGDSDFDILKQSYSKMLQVINQLWSTRSRNLPYATPYDGLIAASLIEKETALKRERPLIASVILNRLRANMRLQIDPTVIYGLGGDENRSLTHADIQHYTAYNTYLTRGLPPTPIAMPSKSSIEAALHPAKTKYLYFVAKRDGSHQFSETYQQHLQAVRKYLNNRYSGFNNRKKLMNSASKRCQFSDNNANLDVLKRLFQPMSYIHSSA